MTHGLCKQPLGGYREIVSSLRKTGLGTGATTAIPPALVGALC